MYRVCHFLSLCVYYHPGALHPVYAWCPYTHPTPIQHHYNTPTTPLQHPYNAHTQRYYHTSCCSWYHGEMLLERVPCAGCLQPMQVLAYPLLYIYYMFIGNTYIFVGNTYIFIGNT